MKDLWVLTYEHKDRKWTTRPMKYEDTFQARDLILRTGSSNVQIERYKKEEE